MRPALLVPDTLEVHEVTARMREARQEFAAVVDEYGGLAGILTFEDIAEELVGEIADENDVAEADPTRGEGIWVLNAATRIAQVRDLTGAGAARGRRLRQPQRTGHDPPPPVAARRTRSRWSSTPSTVRRAAPSSRSSRCAAASPGPYGCRRFRSPPPRPTGRCRGPADLRAGHAAAGPSHRRHTRRGRGDVVDPDLCTGDTAVDPLTSALVTPPAALPTAATPDGDGEMSWTY